MAEPEHFDPDRWLPGRAGKVQREAYVPFGEAPVNASATLNARSLWRP
ncbi:cytochrome P450 [Streptomyces sp. NPDC040724]